MKQFEILLVIFLLCVVVSMAKTHYEVLKVSRTASAAEVKKAYRALAKKYHPDKLKHSRKVEFVGKPVKEKENEKFLEITKAYEVLSDDSLRRQYDDELRFGPHSGSNYHQQQQQPGGGRFHRNDFQHFQRRHPFGREEPVDMDDILRGFNGRGQRRRQQSAADETIYMYRGADGRTYYTTRSAYEQQQHGGDANIFQLTASLFPFLVMVALGLCSCVACVRTLGSAVGSQDRDTTNATRASQRTTQGSDDKSTTPPSKQSLLPVFSLDGVVSRKSIIHILALSPANVQRLARCRLKFRADPLAFTDATNVGDDEKTFIVDILGDFFASHPEQEPENKNVDCFFVAVCKGGSKYSMFCLEEIDAVGEKEDQLKAERVCMESLQQWLERLVEGRVSWEASF